MRWRVRRLSLLCLLLLLPSWLKAQRPLDEGQQQRIGITSQQAKELEALFDNAEQQRHIINSRLHGLYNQLHSLYDTYDFDQQQTRQIRASIVIQQQQLLVLYADNEIKLRRILNRDQFDRLRAELKKERERHRRERPDEYRKPWRSRP